MTIRDGMVVRKRGKFKEDSKASNHPVVVLLHDDKEVWGVICTSADHISDYPNSIELDYTACGLSKPTIAICDKLSRFEISRITKVEGELSDNDYIQVGEAASKFNAVDNLFERRIRHGA